MRNTYYTYVHPSCKFLSSRLPSRVPVITAPRPASLCRHIAYSPCSAASSFICKNPATNQRNNMQDSCTV